MPGCAEEGVILEFVQVSRHVQVSAVDTKKNGVEVSIFRDLAQGEMLLKRTAVQNFNME